MFAELRRARDRAVVDRVRRPAELTADRRRDRFDAPSNGPLVVRGRGPRLLGAEPAARARRGRRRRRSAGSATSTRSASTRFAPPVPGRAHDHALRRRARRRRGRRGRHRHAGVHALRPLHRAASPAGKHTFVEKPLAPSAALADELAAARARARARADVRAHVRLQPAGPRGQADARRSGRLGDVYFISSSRVNLGLHQRDVSVIWDLGPHDFSILLHWLGELPESVRAVGPRLDRHGHPRRRLRHAALPVGDRRQRRAELALARASCAGPSSSAARRWSSTRTARRSRSGSSTTASSTRTRRRSASTSSPTARATSSRRSSRRRAAAAWSSRTSVVPSARGTRCRYHAALARDVVAITEAASRSLEAGGAEVQRRALRAVARLAVATRRDALATGRRSA